MATTGGWSYSYWQLTRLKKKENPENLSCFGFMND